MIFKEKLIKSGLIMGISVILGSISYGLTGAEKQEKTDKEDVDKRAFIYLKQQKGKDDNYTIMSVPETLEDKEWKSLFAKGQSTQKSEGSYANLLDQVLWIFETSEKEFNTKKSELLLNIIKFLAPALKPFELQSVPTGGKDKELSHSLVTFTNPCHCCQTGRYHLEELPAEKNATHAITQRISDIQVATRIEWSGLQAHNKLLRKALVDISPKLYKKLFREMPEKIGLRAVIFGLCHEMVHLARLDALAKLTEQESDATFNATICKKKEHQADFIALLILQNEEYFLSAIHYLAQTFLMNFYAQVDYLLSIDPTNNDLLEEIVMFHQQAEDLIKLPQPVRKQVIALRKSKYQVSNDTHPACFRRLQQALTTWAAYLMYGQDEKLSKSEAIDHVAKTCLSLFGGYEITNKSIEKLLCRIVEDWAKSHST